MHKWLQKEFFFVGMLCFIFVATASTATFAKRYLHSNLNSPSTALVIWPQSQAAIYPKKPLETPSATPVATRTAIALKPSVKRKRVTTRPKRRIVRRVTRRANISASRRYTQKRYRSAYYKRKTNPSTRSKTIKKAALKTTAQRNYESDMAWVRKTLKAYQER